MTVGNQELTFACPPSGHTLLPNQASSTQTPYLLSLRWIPNPTFSASSTAKFLCCGFCAILKTAPLNEKLHKSWRDNISPRLRVVLENHHVTPTKAYSSYHDVKDKALDSLVLFPATARSIR